MKETAMTTQATTIERSRRGFRALMGATALTAVVLAGAALWLVRPDGPETATPAARSAAATTSEGAIPVGGLAGQSHEDQWAEPPSLGVVAITDGAGRYFTERQVSAARVATNGMAELDVEPVGASTGTRRGSSGACGATAEPAVQLIVDVAC
jgi:hypothetical protein